MARAKRTARADARRNYRAAQGVVDDADLDPTDADADADAEAAPSAKGASESRKAAAQAPAATVRPRPSIAAAFRGAFRPLDLPGDLKALPRLLIHISFLIPVATIVGITAVIIAFGGQELISRELSQFFLAPPPLVPVFIAGFLAPRASWLLGGLLGVVQTLAVLVIVSTPALGEVVGVPAPDVLASSMAVSVVFGAFYASAMAWYKRFLRGAQPQRPAPPPSKSSQKRQQDNRPLLARRR